MPESSNTHSSIKMFYNADSPSFKESSIMPENNNKGFDNINYGSSEFYDMDAEVSYTDLFTSSGQDQAVPDFMTLNTPVTSSEFNPLNTLSYMPPVTATAHSALPQLESPFYSSASSNYSVSPAPSQAAALPAVPESMYGRGPVIVPSASPQPQKPRRKGGRKPKNDPLPPHLEERRRLRRIRNKDAAQKCRERRLAQTSDLLQEIDQLERQTRYFEETINRMREFKDQCEYILNTHKNNCNMNRRRNVVSGLTTLNYGPMQPCSVAHRRSSSSEGEMSSPTAYIL